jgi:hypothetical protein
MGTGLLSSGKERIGQVHSQERNLPVERVAIVGDFTSTTLHFRRYLQ